VSLRRTFPWESTISNFMTLSPTESWILRVVVPFPLIVPDEGLRTSALWDPARQVKLDWPLEADVSMVRLRRVPPETGQSGVTETFVTWTHCESGREVG
jgi:hypothetical protein